MSIIIYYIMTTFTVILLLFLLLIVYYFVSHTSCENYRSCCWKGCENNCDSFNFDPRNLAEINPFRRPHSSMLCPEDVVFRKKLGIFK